MDQLFALCCGDLSLIMPIVDFADNKCDSLKAILSVKDLTFCSLLEVSFCSDADV